MRLFSFQKLNINQQKIWNKKHVGFFQMHYLMMISKGWSLKSWESFEVEIEALPPASQSKAYQLAQQKRSQNALLQSSNLISRKYDNIIALPRDLTRKFCLLSNYVSNAIFQI